MAFSSTTKLSRGFWGSDFRFTTFLKTLCTQNFSLLMRCLRSLPQALTEIIFFAASAHPLTFFKTLKQQN
ncbi:MAG TPA: hypothetical protein DEA47_05060 [Peptococcaceae bacterium]|nr:hypothetical protein [Peptococcaceae bacterium]